MDNTQESFYNVLEHMRQEHIKYFELTGGGEPFLNIRLQDIIDEIRKYIPDAFIKLYTNGSIHRNVSNIDELDISAVHWNPIALNAVYKTSPERDLLEELKLFYHPEEYKIRLSVPIYKGGIDNKIKAERLIMETQKYVDRYVFRPMLEKTPDYEQLYVDFNIEGENVEVDRECSCFSKVLLWWTNNKIYTDWELKRCLEL